MLNKYQFRPSWSQTIAPLILATLFIHSNLALSFGISAKGIFATYGQNVHETLTYLAAVETGFVKAQDPLPLKYLIEGARFNDDPEGHLLTATEEDSANIIGFAAKFFGDHRDFDIKDATKATHFGDFQFMHAMGKLDSSADETKDKIILYAMHCWRIVTSPNSFQEFNAAYDVVDRQLKNPKPNFEYTPEQLSFKKVIRLFPKKVIFFHARNQMQFRYRALGSLLHLIQDSYAKGHVVRTGWESGGNSGDIQYFQSYLEQDAYSHKNHDNHPSGSVSKDNIFEIPGARIAFERSKQILIMAANNCQIANGGQNAKDFCQQRLPF